MIFASIKSVCRIGPSWNPVFTGGRHLKMTTMVRNQLSDPLDAEGSLALQIKSGEAAAAAPVKR